MDPHSSLLTWLEHQVGFENYNHLFERSLERIALFFNPWVEEVKKRKIKIITIAGTNGKGQTSYACAELLKAENKSFSLFISPHIHSILERFQNEEGYYQENSVKKTFDKILLLSQQNNIKLSFFEFLFATFLELALDKKSDFLILEVGVGGRLDATNLLDADVAIITSIGRDHQDLLGTRLDMILKEKLGITRPHKCVITNFPLKYLKNAVKDFCIKNQILHMDLSEGIGGSENISFDFYKSNRMLAYSAVQYLLEKYLLQVKKMPIPLDEFMNKDAELPGRGEKFIGKSGIKFCCYGAHNVDGMRAWFCRDINYNSQESYDLVLLSFSKRSFADILVMIKQWKFAHKIYPLKYKKILITCFSHTKAFVPNDEEKKEILNLVAEFDQTIFYFQNWKEYKRFLTIRDNINLLVIGSFYFVSEVKLQQSKA